jgi:hypothetical protein
MDPGDKSIIATYTNDLEGVGGVVFESGGDRFLNASMNKYDNRKYISNIAEWLEQNNNAPAKENVLIYDTFRDGGLDNRSFNREMLTNLGQKGFKVRITDRRETPQISERLLGEYSQLWIFFGESDANRPLTDGELNAISRFTGAGKGLLIVAGKLKPGANDDTLSVNRLSSRYGVLFSGVAENREELPATVSAHFFNRASEVLGRVLKLVHKA